jgi:hypothetical protein
MNLHRRGSWPHPVLSPFGDDIQPSDFGFSLDPVPDGDHWTLRVTASHSDLTMDNRAEAGDAVYALHVECSGTFYRQMFCSNRRESAYDIPATRIVGKVETVLMLVAAKDIKDYRHPGQHDDYGNSVFHISQGEPLAVSETVIFEAFLDADPVLELPSIFDIKRGDEATRLVDAKFEADRIVLELPPDDFDRYRAMRSHSTIRDLIASAVLLPALIQALHYLRALSSEELEDFKANHRWSRIISRRLDKLGIKLEEGADGALCLEAAQKLLRGPLRRALDNIEILFPVSS